MPPIKLNPVGVVGGPAILPISSLWSRPDDVLANVLIAAPASAPLGSPAAAGRPSPAEHQVVAQSAVTQAVELRSLIDHASPADPAGTKASVAAWHDEGMLHLDIVPRSDGAAAAPDHAVDAVSATPAAPTLAAIMFDTPDTGETAATFLTVCSAAFRGPDITHGDPHELLTLPLHDVAPIDGALPMFG